MRFVVLLSMLGSAGCARYVLLEHPALNAPVTATLTDRGSVEMSEAIGSTAVRIDGRLIALTDTTLSVAVAKVQFRNGRANVWNGESVTVPRGYIATMRQRHVSRGRTVALGTLLLGGLVAFIKAIDLHLFGNEGGKGPPNPGPSPG